MVQEIFLLVSFTPGAWCLVNKAQALWCPNESIVSVNPAAQGATGVTGIASTKGNTHCCLERCVS